MKTNLLLSLFFFISTSLYSQNHEEVIISVPNGDLEIKTASDSILMTIPELGDKIYIEGNAWTKREVKANSYLVIFTLNDKILYDTIRIWPNYVTRVKVDMIAGTTEQEQIHMNDIGEQTAETEKADHLTEEEMRNAPCGDMGIYFIVEEMPKFRNRDKDEFRNWITENLKYPVGAAKNGEQGRVFVQFVVNKYGYITDAKIVRGATPMLDAEALRVVRASPRWIPGKQRSENVCVQFTFPIVFILDTKRSGRRK